jgi:hypothetical protein
MFSKRDYKKSKGEFTRRDSFDEDQFSYLKPVQTAEQKQIAELTDKLKRMEIRNKQLENRVTQLEYQLNEHQLNKGIFDSEVAPLHKQEISFAEFDRLIKDQKRFIDFMKAYDQFNPNQKAYAISKAGLVVLEFGKHKNKTLETIRYTDRSYLKWLQSNISGFSWINDYLYR